MFDVGFWELVVVGIVALLVFGPEKLPRMARTAGYWVNRIRRQVSQFRADVEREIALDEIRNIQRPIDMPDEIKSLADDIKSASSDVTKSIANTDKGHGV